jgi:hypothetical protein
MDNNAGDDLAPCCCCCCCCCFSGSHTLPELLSADTGRCLW